MRTDLFPSWRYHKDNAFPPKLVNTAEDAAELGPDWSNGDDPNAPVKEQPGPVPPEPAPKVLYPSWRYHRTDPTQPPVLVKTVEADLALGPEWWNGDAAPAGAAPASEPVAPDAEVASPEASPATSSAAINYSKLQALLGGTVADIKAALPDLSDEERTQLGVLERNGAARKGVLSALGVSDE